MSKILMISLFTIVPASAAETDLADVGDITITYIENDGSTATKSGCIQLTADTKTPKEDNQVARIRNISASRLSDTFVLTVNGEYEVHYSPLNYCKKALTSDGSSNKLKDVAGALYTYSRLADYYFGKTQPEVIGV